MSTEWVREDSGRETLRLGESFASMLPISGMLCGVYDEGRKLTASLLRDVPLRSDQVAAILNETEPTTRRIVSRGDRMRRDPRWRADVERGISLRLGWDDPLDEEASERNAPLVRLRLLRQIAVETPIGSRRGGWRTASREARIKYADIRRARAMSRSRALR